MSRKSKMKASRQVWQAWHEISGKKPMKFRPAHRNISIFAGILVALILFFLWMNKGFRLTAESRPYTPHSSSQAVRYPGLLQEVIPLVWKKISTL